MRIVKIDALRGIAALVVVLQHAMEKFLSSGVAGGNFEYFFEAIFKNFMNFGRFGVAIFFVISGFVVPFSFRSERPLLAFGVSRFFRLYPAYWFSLIFALFAFYVIGKPFPPVGEVLANVTMFQKFMGIDDVVGAYWSLAIELMFYALCAVLFMTGRLTDAYVLLFAVLLLLASSLGLGMMSTILGRHFPSGVPLHLSLMFLGTLMRRGWYDNDPLAKKMIAPLVALMVFAIPAIQWSSYSNIGIVKEYNNPLAFTMGYYVAISVFIFCMVRSVEFGKVSIWLGAVSYSVYVLHGPVLEILTFYISPDSPAKAMVFFMLMFGVTIFLSGIVYTFVEKPCVKIGHRVMAGLSKLQVRNPA